MTNSRLNTSTSTKLSEPESDCAVVCGAGKIHGIHGSRSGLTVELESFPVNGPGRDCPLSYLLVLMNVRLAGFFVGGLRMVSYLAGLRGLCSYSLQ